MYEVVLCEFRLYKPGDEVFSDDINGEEWDIISPQLDMSRWLQYKDPIAKVLIPHPWKLKGYDPLEEVVTHEFWMFKFTPLPNPDGIHHWNKGGIADLLENEGQSALFSEEMDPDETGLEMLLKICERNKEEHASHHCYLLFKTWEDEWRDEDSKLEVQIIAELYGELDLENIIPSILRDTGEGWICDLPSISQNVLLPGDGE